MDEKKTTKPQEISREEFMKRLRPGYRKRQGEKCQAASRRQARQKREGDERQLVPFSPAPERRVTILQLRPKGAHSLTA